MSISIGANMVDRMKGIEKDEIAVPRQLLIDLVTSWNKEGVYSMGDPSHGHDVPGIWDIGNRHNGGQPCKSCQDHDQIRRIISADPIRERQDYLIRIDELEKMLFSKLDLIKCGIAANYSGNPCENSSYTDILLLLNKGV